jgi:cytochrome d ubiquinol oxidase subunit I
MFSWRWKHVLQRKWWLIFIAGTTPIGFIAVEAGWTVTEVGRQPWIIYGVMRTKDAVSSMPGLQYSFYVITAVYILLSLIIVWLMRRQIKTVDQFYPSAKSE